MPYQLALFSIGRQTLVPYGLLFGEGAFASSAALPLKYIYENSAPIYAIIG